MINLDQWEDDGGSVVCRSCSGRGPTVMVFMHREHMLANCGRPRCVECDARGQNVAMIDWARPCPILDYRPFHIGHNGVS